jgi:Helix-hairpin-helix motif
MLRVGWRSSNAESHQKAATFVSPRVARGLSFVWGGVLLAASAVAVTAPLGAQSAAANLEKAKLAREAKSLKAVCGQCHGLPIVMDTPMSYEGWHDTVQKMLDQGAVASDAQLADIMDYLHRTMTRIDVNAADEDELRIVLNFSQEQAQAVVARRSTQKFKDLADLKTVQGLDAASLEAKASLISFQ